jgi:hypothetical protein
MNIPWKAESAAPPRHFPIAIADPPAAATGIAEKPDSRPQTIEAAEKWP